jgi:hypothetical protein
MACYSPNKPLTQARLKELVSYDPETGAFRRLVKRTSSVRTDGIPRTQDRGYLRFSVDGRTYPGHALAWLYMTGEWPTHEIDHKDRDPANNRWVNLRHVTTKQNTENSVEQANNTSGRRGVHLRTWRSHAPKWIARIGHNGRRIHLGAFDSREDAVEFRDLAESMLFTCAPRA